MIAPAIQQQTHSALKTPFPHSGDGVFLSWMAILRKSGVSRAFPCARMRHVGSYSHPLMPTRRTIKYCLFLLMAPAASQAAGGPSQDEVITFSHHIRPILSENCFFCHGPDEKKREADLRLDDETSAKKNNDGVIAVVPGDPAKSALIQRIVSTDPDEVMPPPKQHKTISPAQVALLKEWIKQGAKWGKHWSYEKVVKPAVPKIAEFGMRNAEWQNSAHPIDAFIAQRLKKEGLQPSPQVDAAALIRRFALDLTGLPPTPEEVERLRDSALRTPHSALASNIAPLHCLRQPG